MSTADATPARVLLSATGMEKRKRCELAVSSHASGFGDSEVWKNYAHLHPIWNATEAGRTEDHDIQILCVSQVPRSEEQDAAEFGGSEVWKNYAHLHPIWKAMEAGRKEDQDNQILSMSQVPRSEEHDARFGGSEVWKNYAHLHPIWKATEVGRKDHHNQILSMSQVPRSEEQDAGFGGSEVWKNYAHLHPIWKATEVDQKENHDNQILSTSQVPRSEEQDAAGFGGSEVWKNYAHLHPIWKATEVGGKEDHDNQILSMSQVRRSEEQDAAGFGGSEVMKGYYLHHLWKTTQGGTEKNSNNQLSSISLFPKGQRSKRRVRRRCATAQLSGILNNNPSESDEASISENRNQCPLGMNLYKPWNARGKRTVEATLLGQLDSQKFEYYIKIIWTRFSEEKKNAFTYLDSLWFSLYTRGPLKKKVLDWIRRKNIFSKKYVFVPIVQWSHWFLLILCHFDESPKTTTQTRCMLLLDSLQKANSRQLEPEIRRFVLDIFQAAKQPDKKELIRKIPLWIPKVPQQRNGDECGFYVLYYINLFLQNAPDNFSFSNGHPHFMKEDWLNPAGVECFIKSLDFVNNGPASNH